MPVRDLEFSETPLALTAIRVRRAKSKPADVASAGEPIPAPANAEVQGLVLDDDRPVLAARHWREAQILALRQLACGLGDAAEHLAYVRDRLAGI